MEEVEKTEIKEKAGEISQLLTGGVESKYRALEVAEGVSNATMRRRLMGQVVSDLTLTLEAQGTPEAMEESAKLKQEYSDSLQEQA